MHAHCALDGGRFGTWLRCPFCGSEWLTMCDVLRFGMERRPRQPEPTGLARKHRSGVRPRSTGHVRQAMVAEVSRAVPPGSPSWVTSDLIAETIRVWQPYYRVPLTSQDAVEMIMSVGQLFDVLFEGRKV
jgi:hypothetical protein